MWQNQGTRVFENVPEAIRAGYEILSVHPDADGYLRARTKVDETHYGLALIAVRTSVR
jgi:hypothetical protein